MMKLRYMENEKLKVTLGETDYLKPHLLRLLNRNPLNWRYHQLITEYLNSMKYQDLTFVTLLRMAVIARLYTKTPLPRAQKQSIYQKQRRPNFGEILFKTANYCDKRYMGITDPRLKENWRKAAEGFYQILLTLKAPDGAKQDQEFQQKMGIVEQRLRALTVTKQ